MDSQAANPVRLQTKTMQTFVEKLQEDDLHTIPQVNFMKRQTDAWHNLNR